MTFTLIEKSVSDGRPIEAYRLTQYVNGSPSTTYRYTTHNLPITLGGATYTPIPMTRSEIKVGTQNDDQLEISIELPASTPVVTTYAFNQSLPDLTLEVFRYHRGSDPSTDFQLIWKGPVNQFEVVGNVCTIKSPNIFSKTLQTQYPQTNYQTQCNHILFGPLCKASRSANTYHSTVQSITNKFIVVMDDHTPDNYLNGGELVVDRTGERRLMGNNVSNTLEVNFKFADIVVGDVVTFTAGCDHTYATCKAKFSNGTNFGGFPFIPADNPFVGQLATPANPTESMNMIVQMLIDLGIGLVYFILEKIL